MVKLLVMLPDVIMNHVKRAKGDSVPGEVFILLLRDDDVDLIPVIEEEFNLKLVSNEKAPGYRNARKLLIEVK